MAGCHQAGSGDCEGGDYSIYAPADVVEGAVCSQLTLGFVQKIGQGVFLRVVVGKELGAGMDAVFSGPVAIGVDHAGREKADMRHLIAAECAVALAHLAVPEVPFVGAVSAMARRLRKSALGKLSPVRGLRGLLSASLNIQSAIQNKP
jgi:hypothetical protein